MLRHALKIFFLSFFLLSDVWAANSLALVLSDNTPPYREFSGTLKDGLQDSPWKVSSIGNVDSIDPANPPQLIVTVGIEAFRQTLARSGNTPIMATLIGRQIYEKSLSEASRNRPRSSVIYIEQPLHRQAAFLRQLLPGKTQIGLLHSSEGRSQVAPLRQALSATGLNLDTEESESDETLLPAANALLARTQLLLAIPDAKIYKRDNIKTILLTSYRHQKPLIAFSSTFVTAGALAAIYSTPAQIARQAAEMIKLHGLSLPAADYPAYFSVGINRSVADALNIQLADESDIKRAMSSKEAR
jgi:ABC-type uncharacterized transport system substrate-binding protein